jgi:hypothetical protein
MTSEVLRDVVFICHATPEDNHFVSWLGAKLAAMGYDVWADVLKLRGGADWNDELQTALRKRAAKVLLVCTAAGVQKKGVRSEIEIASRVSAQIKDHEFIIPLRLENFEAPFRVALAQYIDFERGWAQGLAELTELLKEKAVPRGKPGRMEDWLASHAVGAARLLAKAEPLVSNWLEVFELPACVRYCEPLGGFPIDTFQRREAHHWPVVPHKGGVITFARPNAEAQLGPEVPANLVAEVATEAFLEEGWPTQGIDVHQARRIYSDLGTRAFDKLSEARGLKGYAGSGRRLSWWPDIKTAPLTKVRFDWGFRRGLRQIIGQSKKRNVHWHYAVSVNLRSAPVRHIRLAARLIFSDNGLDAIADARKAHVLRRSFAKGWRNARWRDMLCAYLWWLTDGRAELRLPVGDEEFIRTHVPPMQFSSPVSIANETDDAADDDDDPDVPEDGWEDDGKGDEAEETEE